MLDRSLRRMTKDLESVTTWLTAASAAVPSGYFALPVAGQEKPIYRERVYCYELYHQWRSRWPKDFDYSIGGEIDKSGNRLVRSGAKPDFLVHVPGVMDNLLAMEVKPANGERRKMARDLSTLTYFRRALGDDENYFAAYFWIYGLRESQWRRLAADLVVRTRGQPSVDLRLVQPVIHSRAGEPMTVVTWE